MNRIKRWNQLAFLLFFCLALPAIADMELSGATIDNIRIGMNTDEVLKLKGEPSSRGPEEYYQEWWAYKEKNQTVSKLLVVFHPNTSTVRGIRGQELKLKSGITLGEEKIDDLLTRFGEQEKRVDNVEGDGTKEYIWRSSEGISLSAFTSPKGIAYSYILTLPKKD